MNKRYYLLFVPLLLLIPAMLDSMANYFVAWLGSIYLLYVTLTGKIEPLPSDLPFREQVMRPIIIVQVIFCGFNFLTSIFYFMDIIGIKDFRTTNLGIDENRLKALAEAQTYYLVGHVCLLIGIYAKGLNQKVRYKVRENLNWSSFLFWFTLIVYVLHLITLKIAATQQIAEQLRNLSFFSGTFAFCYSIVTRNKKILLPATLFYIYTFMNAMVSGYKEPIIISVLLVCIFLYPYYSKLIKLMIIPFIYVSFFLLPAYMDSFRQLMVNQETEVNVETVRNIAFENALSGDRSNWRFLTNRLSEVAMFTQYIASTPQQVPYYELQLIEQSFINLVPRAIWPDKPVTEKMVMQRVYKAGVVSELALNLSAKPMYIVDGYLSYGLIGIVIAMFIYGYSLQWIHLIAENWFGGYFLGTVIVFNGLFSIYWRGLSFEFILNSVIYAFITMYCVRMILLRTGILEKAEM